MNIKINITPRSVIALWTIIVVRLITEFLWTSFIKDQILTHQYGHFFALLYFIVTLAAMGISWQLIDSETAKWQRLIFIALTLLLWLAAVITALIATTYLLIRKIFCKSSIDNRQS